MGYCMQVRAQSFYIKAENMAGAIAAVKALDGAEEEKGASGGIYSRDGCESKHYSWVQNGFSKKHDTLEGLLKEWGWYPDHDPRGVFGINFEREKIGDEDILFNAIAPFVEPGSYIEMVGEDGTIWRWYFDGSECHEQTGETNFKAESDGADYKDKLEGLVGALTTWVESCEDIDNAQGGRSSVARAEVKDILKKLVEKYGA